MRKILHIDVDAFFASVEQSCNPLIAGKPVIVGGLPHQRGCVHSASYDARRCGIKKGMPLSKAQKLCPDAVFLKGDFRHYQSVGQTIESILYQFSPFVERTSLDDMYVDITAMNRHFPSPVDAALSIQQKILQTLNITVSIGIASSKLIARIASGVNKPAGITYVPPGTEREFLRNLPVQLLRGVGPKTERLLRDIGISSIGQLSRLPKESVIQLFGSSAGDTLWNYANGSDTRPVSSPIIPKQISRETSFEEYTDDAGLVFSVLRYLTERIAGKLRSEDLSGRTIQVKLQYSDGTMFKQSLSIDYDTNDSVKLFEYVRSIFNSRPIRRLCVKLAGVTIRNIVSTDLSGITIFDTLLPNNSIGSFDYSSVRSDRVVRSNRLNQSVDDIRNRFGFMAISAGSTRALQNHYRMENYGYVLHTPSLSQ